jgi:hypothetical protein
MCCFIFEVLIRRSVVIREIPLKTARRFVSFCCLLWVSSVSAAAANDPLEDLLAATFKISQGDHSGTCFLISEPTTNAEHPRRILLATAAHVLEQMHDDDCEIVFRTGSIEQGFHRLAKPVKIRNGDNLHWKRHPDVDVAVMPIEIPESAFAKPIPIDHVATESQLIDRTIHVGQEAWIGCFPAKLEGNETGWPILRKGSIATYPLIPVKTAKTMMIDYKVFGGDSGAPIAIVHDGRPLIIGVASSMQRQTDKSVLPFEERTMHTPMGLSIAVQAPYLRETIELTRQK